MNKKYSFFWLFCIGMALVLTFLPDTGWINIDVNTVNTFKYLGGLFNGLGWLGWYLTFVKDKK